MTVRTSCSHARAHFAAIWDEVESSREAAVIQRRGREDMVLVPADDYASLQETAHLLRSPANAARLLSALARARHADVPATDLAALRRSPGLTDE